ncbi:hypothetical protein SAMN04487857_10489 [Pseudomonas sp. ok272]|uniref:hypothetical protein n=1 Tax=unclassified Pseudomonas TaxID=196821 RepID=UPI0008B124C5|nr:MULTISPECIES: hypothetical protein [unclassified Pseudomonas]SEM69449.1 hypothetical protein SAMN04487857_10489 [Pseudomonas sp. ok272]SFM58155.1 hypothetical protein SAMN04487858_10489 [Pseudomonas sp. ok602]
MKRLVRMGWRRGALVLAVAVLLALIVIATQSEKEIALVIGEPWDDMRQRSSATIEPVIPGTFWGRLPQAGARLRFIDLQYGFVTPVARYFSVTFTKDGLVKNVRMSPQIEPLLLDDTLKVVLDLQEQWRQGGWSVTRPDFPAFADTPQWRAQLQNVRRGGKTYWHAGEQYQIRLGVRRFKDDRHPTQERYLITLGLARPWVKP